MGCRDKVRGRARLQPRCSSTSSRAAPQFIHTLENQREFSARAKVYFASLLTVALHGKLEYYTDIMRTLFLELMEQYVVAKNPKLMLRRFVGMTSVCGVLILDRYKVRSHFVPSLV